MTKFSEAINKSNNERGEMNQANNAKPKKKTRGPIRFAWLYWVIIIGGVITVLVAFNQTDDETAIPLSEIFPDEDVVPMDIEYEFVDQEAVPKTTPGSILESIRIASKEEKVLNVPVAVEPVRAKIEEKVVAAPAPQETTVAKKAETITPKAEIKAEDFKKIPYTIQVASFRDEAKAKEALKKIEAKNYSAYVVKRDLGPKGVWHRIYVGQYQTKSQAEQTLATLSKDYQGSFVISPKK